MAIAPGHPELWTALTALATAAGGVLRHSRKRIRKLERDVAVLKMQIEIHSQILRSLGFGVHLGDAPRSDL